MPKTCLKSTLQRLSPVAAMASALRPHPCH